jgi:hypothetical protein
MLPPVQGTGVSRRAPRNDHREHRRPAALEAFKYCRGFSEHYQPFSRQGASIYLHEPIRVADMALFRQSDPSDDPMLSVYSAERGEIRGGSRQSRLFDEVAFWRSPAETIRAAALHYSHADLEDVRARWRPVPVFADRSFAAQGCCEIVLEVRAH